MQRLMALQPARQAQVAAFPLRECAAIFQVLLPQRGRETALAFGPMSQGCCTPISFRLLAQKHFTVVVFLNALPKGCFSVGLNLCFSRLRTGAFPRAVGIECHEAQLMNAANAEPSKVKQLAHADWKVLV